MLFCGRESGPTKNETETRGDPEIDLEATHHDTALLEKSTNLLGKTSIRVAHSVSFLQAVTEVVTAV